MEKQCNKIENPRCKKRMLTMSAETAFFANYMALKGNILKHRYLERNKIPDKCCDSSVKECDGVWCNFASDEPEPMQERVSGCASGATASPGSSSAANAFSETLDMCALHLVCTGLFQWQQMARPIPRGLEPWGFAHS